MNHDVIRKVGPTLVEEQHLSWALIFKPDTLTSRTQAGGGCIDICLLHATCKRKTLGLKQDDFKF